MKTNNFQEHFYLKLFLDRSITECPKEVHLPWLYFYVDKTWEQRINACVSWSSEGNLYKCGTVITKIVSLQGYRAHRERHPWRHFTDLSPSWGITMNQKRWDLNCSLPHPLRYRMILQRNLILLSPWNQQDSGPIFKYFHKSEQL